MDKMKILIGGVAALAVVGGAVVFLWPEEPPPPEPEPAVEQEMDEFEQQELMMRIGYIQQDEEVLDAMDGAEAQD